MKGRRAIKGFKTCSYIAVCIGLSITYMGAGFIFAITWILVPHFTWEGKLAANVGQCVAFCTGALVTGFYIDHGRRKALLLIDCVCMLFMPLILIPHDSLAVIGYCATPFFEGCWMVAVFVYGKDESIVHQPSFIALFLLVMNAIGIFMANLLPIVLLHCGLDVFHDLFVAKVFIVVGMLLPCGIQLLFFLLYLTSEPIRFEFEKYGEEYVCGPLAQLIEDKQSVQQIVGSLKQVAAYRKFVGIKYTTLLSPGYRKVFVVCLCLFALKASTYLLSFSGRLVPEAKHDSETYAFYLLFHSGVKVLLYSLAILYVDRIQRKTLFAAGFACFALTNVANLVLSILYTYVSSHYAIAYMISISISDYIFFALWTYLPYIFALELLPDKGVAFAIAFYLPQFPLSSFLLFPCSAFGLLFLLEASVICLQHYSNSRDMNSPIGCTFYQPLKAQHYLFTTHLLLSSTLPWIL